MTRGFFFGEGFESIIWIIVIVVLISAFLDD